VATYRYLAPMFGRTYTHVAARSANTGEKDRVILDIRSAPRGRGYGGEARQALDMILDLLNRGAIIRAVTSDGACRAMLTRPIRASSPRQIP